MQRVRSRLLDQCGGLSALRLQDANEPNPPGSRIPGYNQRQRTDGLRNHIPFPAKCAVKLDRKAILHALAVSRTIISDGHEVVPRFTVYAPGGPFTLWVELPDDEAARAKQMEAVRSFMIWKAAHAFILANELINPDAISVIAVTRSEINGALQRIQRMPARFDDPEWFGRENVGDEVVNLLPPRQLAITLEQLEFMRQAFEEGNVPALRGDGARMKIDATNRRSIGAIARAGAPRRRADRSPESRFCALRSP